jgi:hypothetical protein
LFNIDTIVVGLRVVNQPDKLSFLAFLGILLRLFGVGDVIDVVESEVELGEVGVTVVEDGYNSSLPSVSMLSVVREDDGLIVVPFDVFFLVL